MRTNAQKNRSTKIREKNRRTTKIRENSIQNTREKCTMKELTLSDATETRAHAKKVFELGNEMARAEVSRRPRVTRELPEIS